MSLAVEGCSGMLGFTKNVHPNLRDAVFVAWAERSETREFVR